MRSSDINKLRKLRFAQAVLLGVLLVKTPNWSDGKPWRYRLPGADGWRGYYATEYEAVLFALRELQVELKEGNYRHGNKPSCGGAADVLPDAAKT
jgi:hypothetical protein